NRAGRVVAVNNTYLPDVSILSIQPSVSIDQALEIARIELMHNNLSEATTSLVIYPFNGSFSLAWHITVSTSGPTWDLFIDAHSGALLGTPRDINRYFVSGTGQVFNVNAIVATHDTTLRDNNDAASAVPASAYKTVTLQGLAGNGFLDGQYA